MHDARDAEDIRLLAAGELDLLMEGYYGLILNRCRARIRDERDAIGVAAEVVIRLLGELKRGKTYAVPFRVVVNQVIGWKIKEHFAPAAVTEVELGDDAGSADDPFEAFEAEHDLRALVADFPQREREVILLRLIEGISPDEIAERLDTTRNNVDQGWFHGLRRMARRLEVA